MAHSKDEVHRAFPFFKNYPDTLTDLYHYVYSKTLPTNSTLYTEGDVCTHIGFLLSGEIRIFKTGGSGREITLYEIGTGDTCILTASCILAQSRYPAEARTSESTKLLLLPADRFKHLFETHPAMQLFIHTLFAQRLTTLMSLVEEIVFHRMDQRLHEYLIERSADNLIQRTHQRIANDLGTSREVVSRLLQDFQRQGVVHCRRNQIELLSYQSLR